MDDYIKRSDAVHALCKAVHKDDGVIPCENQTASCLWSKTRVCDYAREIDAVPSADVQPVQRGHWQEAKTRTYGIYECDVCKGWTYIPNKPRDYKFCPRCGARMDGEKE